MTSKLTREELLNIIKTDHVQCGEASALARMALAAMDSEPVAEVIQKLNGYDRPLYVVAIEGDVEEGDVLYRHAQLESEVVVTRNERGDIVAVTRQDAEGRVIDVIAEAAQPAPEYEPVKRFNADQMHRICLEANRHLDKYGAMAKEVNKLLGRIPAQPVPELKPVGYLFVSDQGAIAYSPTDWGMPGFNLAGQIFGDIDVKEQSAPVAVIQSSKPLYDFYRDYADWISRGGDGRFSCSNGLCANLFDYCGHKDIDSAQVLNEMHAQFVTAGLKEKLPFNVSGVDFDAESADGECHLNTGRREWVAARISDGIKPAPVVLDIDELRLAFEAAERESDDGFNLHKYGIGYADDETQGRWDTWLACRAAMLNGGKP